MGFGWSFYGFFIGAVIWLLLYFLWAFSAAARDRRHAAGSPPASRLEPRASNDR